MKLMMLFLSLECPTSVLDLKRVVFVTMCTISLSNSSRRVLMIEHQWNKCYHTRNNKCVLMLLVFRLKLL